MGIYVYTMRKDSIVVDGIHIGRFAFAYKMGRDWQPGGKTSIYIDDKKTGRLRAKMNRTVLMLEAAAERARNALPHIEHIVAIDSFKDIKKYGRTEVFKIPTDMEMFIEELPERHVGYLIAEGKSFRYQPK